MQKIATLSEFHGKKQFARFIFAVDLSRSQRLFNASNLITRRRRRCMERKKKLRLHNVIEKSHVRAAYTFSFMCLLNLPYIRDLVPFFFFLTTSNIQIIVIVERKKYGAKIIT